MPTVVRKKVGLAFVFSPQEIRAKPCLILIIGMFHPASVRHFYHVSTSFHQAKVVFVLVSGLSSRLLLLL